MAEMTMTRQAPQQRQRTRWTPGRIFGDVALPTAARIVLWVWAAFNVALLIWVMITALKPDREVFDFLALPSRLAWSNLATAWTSAGFGTAFWNTVVYAVLTAGLSVALGAPAAYAIARSGHRLSGWMLVLFSAGMTIPHQIVLVPYVVMNASVDTLMVDWVTGWWDPRIFVLLVSIAWQIPFSVLVLEGFFRTLPGELEEAASIDGADRWQIFRKVMLPLASPGLRSVFVLNLITAWNETLLILVLITDPAKRTLGPALLTTFGALQNQSNWGVLFAGVAIVTFPILVVFAWAAGRILEGVTAGVDK
ncbi:ABC transporter permease [Enemella evansiae]|uniref:ABC transporter permease n=2 Tax=Enemella evansiae TaxID=2016499 RepID=A0A255G9H3_9ACTN|nr:ABC transporter permease [Enemella evansiae]OYO05550.1 ABC transporter permease [Enemella evansiae]OYO09504.1 ABC transporter permease [Enemella evansiae]